MKIPRIKALLPAYIGLGTCYLLVLCGLLLLLHSQQQRRPQVESFEANCAANTFVVRGKNLPQNTRITLVRDDERCSAVIATKFMWGRVFDVKIAARTNDTLAWALCNNIGLVALDISNPEQPEIIHTVHIDKFLWNLDIQGDKAYIACGKEGIVICDISSLTEARVVTHIPLQYTAIDLSVGPEALYVCHGKNGISVINPSSGEIIEHLELPGTTLNLAYRDAKLFVLGHKGTRGFVHIYAVGDKSEVQLHDILEFEGIPRDYLFWDDSLYLANSSGGVGILKTAPDGSIKFKGSIHTPFRSNRLERYGDKLGVFGKNGDIAIYTLGANDTFELESHLNTCSKIFSTTIFGDYVIIGANEKGISIVDLRSATNQSSRLKASLTSSHNNANWQVTEHATVVRHAYKIQYYKHLSSPGTSTSSLDLTGAIRVPSPVFSAFAVANPEADPESEAWIYAPIQGSGLHIVHVGADGAMEQKGVFKLPIEGKTYVNACVTYADKLYLCSAKGLLIFDISTPATPLFLRTEFQAQNIYNITFGAQHAYIAGAGVHICLIKPDNSLGDAVTIDFPEHLISSRKSRDTTLADGVLYVACGSRGILSIDVRDPQRPIILDSISLQGYCSKVEAAGGMLAAKTTENVYMLDISNPKRMELMCQLGDMQDFHINTKNNEMLQLLRRGIASIPLPVSLKPTSKSTTKLEFHLPTHMQPGRYKTFINFDGSRSESIGSTICTLNGMQHAECAPIPLTSR